jgi:hypothetical protein
MPEREASRGDISDADMPTFLTATAAADAEAHVDKFGHGLPSHLQRPRVVEHPHAGWHVPVQETAVQQWPAKQPPMQCSSAAVQSSTTLVPTPTSINEVSNGSSS